MGKSGDFLPGTLEMLILKTLSLGSQHGYGIAQRIRQTSESVLAVEEGSLYPALQRLLINGFVRAEWKQSETNRRARYYRLTVAGQKQLDAELNQYRRVNVAIEKVLQTT